MTSELHQKVTAHHLQRNAYLYVRQSTVRQVFENQESTKRQYALRQRAVALGWSLERIIVIDSDLGRSGASTDREGFQKLVTEVSMGRAGIVLGLEVSRLARNSMDWHRLLEISALTDTLILDEDGVYNPCDFNDRLLLGLKGTMSEAELHVLRARLRGGILNKARRGELRTPLPVGLVYGASGRVELDPDRQVQEAIHHLFRTFRRTGSARATVKAFRLEQVLFPRRLRHGPRKGEIVWGAPCHWRVLQVLHNPRYAGAFVFGRHRTRQRPDGGISCELLPREQWHTLLRDAHPGYLSWEEYEENQRRLRECAQARGRERRLSPPREGPALLQGRVVCGVCGTRMTVRYHVRQGKASPDYVCQRRGIETATPICQHIPGAAIDQAVGALLLDTVRPAALEVALQVQEELRARIDEADHLRRQRVEHARYETELARRRFMQVDPDNRLVADALEAEWNEKLRALSDAQEVYEQQQQADRAVLGDGERERILALATDFPALWNNPRTPDRERKRMLALLIEDVTLRKSDRIAVHVRFRGGVDKTLILPLPQRAWELRRTSDEIVKEIDRLLDNHTDAEIAALLNQRGAISGMKKPFSSRIIMRLRRDYRLPSRYDRLRASGLMTVREIAKSLGVCTSTVKNRAAAGLLTAHRFNDKNECLYESPGDHPPVKMQGQKLSTRRRVAEIMANRTEEVQSGA